MRGFKRLLRSRLITENGERKTINRTCGTVDLLFIIFYLLFVIY